MEPSTSEDGSLYWSNEKKYIHREDGPALITPNGTEEYYIDGRQLNKKNTKIAIGLLNGSLFNQIPLYINDPILKPFCQTALTKGSNI